MQALFPVLRILFVLVFIPTLLAYFMGAYKLFVALFSLLVAVLSASSINKAIEVGLDTVRGRFFFLMGIGFIVVFVGELLRFMQVSLETYSWIIGISRILISASVAMVTLKVVAFMNLLKWIVFFVVFLLAFIMTKEIFLQAIRKPNLFILTIFSPALVMLSTINMLSYWGSDMGKRWMIGALATYTVIFGDIFFAKDMLTDPQFFYWHNIFWVLGYTLVAIASLIRE